MHRSSSLLPLFCLVAGCAAGGRDRPDTPGMMQRGRDGTGWRAIATEADRTRLRGWRETWVSALAHATAAGFGPKIAAQGALLRPDGALDEPAPPPGAYRCRVTKLGAKSRGLLDYIAYPAFACRVAAGPAGTLSLTKVDGSQRPVGTLYPQDADRMVFLGTMVLGDERRALPYGRDTDRDMIGALERIGPKRWRLVLPSPRWESLLDVVELIPA